MRARSVDWAHVEPAASAATIKTKGRVEKNILHNVTHDRLARGVDGYSSALALGDETRIGAGIRSFPRSPGAALRRGSRLVLVPVTVNGHQRPIDIDGLEASDFSLFDNGQPQKATVDTMDTGVAPVALVIAVQSSGISAAALEKVRKIAAMIQPLITGDRGCAAVVSFAERIKWLQEFRIRARPGYWSTEEAR